jgi:acetoin utilization deacetylase AcuC-like enzyme
MIVLFSPDHARHAPAYEFFRGERVPCFETPSRAEYVRGELVARGHSLRAPMIDARPALTAVHAARYVDFVASAWDRWLALDAANADRQPFPSVWPIRTLRSDVQPTDFIARLGLYSFDNGTPLSAGTWVAAKAAADAAVSAAHLLAGGQRAVFCASRPPGHHAGVDFMGGYCFFNNAALAAHALRALGCDRVAVLDVDYHHGNGTQAIFFARPDVFVASIHADPAGEYPFYSGYADENGADAGVGFNRNFPLPKGTGAEAWFAALEEACSAVDRCRVDALVVSLGLDTFAGDPLSGFRLDGDDFVRLGRRLKGMNLPTAFILEGGYAAAALGVNAANVLDGYENG